MGVLVIGITQKLHGGQEERQGCGTGGGKIQMGVLVKGITQKLYGGQEGRQEFGTWEGVMQQPHL